MSKSLAPDSAQFVVIDEDVTAAAFRFDPHQPRDGDGKWTDGPLGGVGTLIKKTTASTKKVTPAVIYKKHDDGAVIGHSAGGQRMRWDAGSKKYVVEKRQNDKWVAQSSLAKGAAYNELKKPDTWFEPGDDDDNGQVNTPSSTPDPAPANTPAEDTNAPVTNDSLSPSGTKIKPSAIYAKHDDGATVAQSADGAKRMRWDAGRKKFIVEKQKGDGWAEESALTKGAAYNDAKNPDKWFEPSQTSTENEPSSPSLTPEPAPADTDTTAETTLPPQADIEMPDVAPPAEVAAPTKMGMSADDAQKFISDWGANVDLSDDDRQAIKDWATPDMSAMRGMQTHLHGDGELTADEIALRDKLDDIANRGKLTEPVKAYRVVKPWADIEGDPTGKTITDRGFQSTSLAPDDVISMWGGVYAASGDNPVIFEMNVPEGMPAFTPEWNKSTFAHELTLGRDVDMKITGTRDETMFVPGLGKEHTFKVLTMDVTPRTKTDVVDEPQHDVAPEIPKQADAPEIESTSATPYVGPTVTDYAGAPKDVTDEVRQAYLAQVLHEQRVDDRANELRATNPEKYTGFNAWSKSMDDARVELASDAPPDSDLDDALNALKAALPDYTVRDNIRRRLHLEASVERRFTGFAEKNGLGEVTPELKADLAKRTKDAFAGKKVAVRVTPKTVEHILSTGRVKSQFETNKSSGKKDIDMRASVERLLFGIDDKPWQNAEKRPIYGYVAMDGIRPAGIGSAQLGDPSTDALSQYGQVQVVLKDSVRDRTTALFGDSLNNMQEAIPTPINDPDWRSFQASRGGITGHGLEGLDRSGEGQDFRAGAYAEAQIHGGVGIEDIEEIVFPSNPTATVKKQLEDAGIPWRVLNFKTAADGSDEDRANALRIAQQDKPFIEGAIAKLQEKLADPKFMGDEYYKKDLAKYEKQLKAIDDALPLLEGTKTSPAKKVAAAKAKVAKAKVTPEELTDDESKASDAEVALPDVPKQPEAPKIESTPEALSTTAPGYAGPSVKIPPTLKQETVDEYLALAVKQAKWEVDPKSTQLTSAERMELYKLDVEIGKQSDGTIRSRVEQLGKIEASLDAWRTEHGLADVSADEFKQQLTDETQQAFAGKKIGVRVTPQALAVVLSDGRFKTQFETNTSAGYNNPEFRAMFEARWFGIGQGLSNEEAAKVAPEKRPIYGYVMMDGVRPADATHKDVLSWYGDIQVVLKDDVRKRTTAMFGDSLNDHKYGMPSPVDNPSWESFTPMPRGGNSGTHGLTLRDRDVTSEKNFKSHTYAEAQIHDGVSTDDIEEVIFAEQPDSTQITSQLDAAGIPWRVVDHNTVSIPKQADAPKIESTPAEGVKMFSIPPSVPKATQDEYIDLIKQQDYFGNLPDDKKQQKDNLAKQITDMIDDKDEATRTIEALEQLGRVETTYDEFRTRHNITTPVEEHKAELAAKVKDAFADKDIAIRVTPESLSSILSSGRFMSQFESGLATGVQDMGGKARHEASWFGTSPRAKDDKEKRAIYGYVALNGIVPADSDGSAWKGGPDKLSMFGKVQVVLKKDVRSRTAAMYGDSAVNWSEGRLSPIDNPTWESFTGIGDPKNFSREKALRDLDRDPTSFKFRSTAYAEAAITGGVTADDIAEVVFDKNPDPAIQEQLAEKGIPWRVLTVATAVKAAKPNEREPIRRMLEANVQHYEEAIKAAEAERDEYEAKGWDGSVKEQNTEIKKLNTQLTKAKNSLTKFVKVAA